MSFTTITVPGTDALRVLNQSRQHFPATGQYPFLIGDQDELERIEETMEFNKEDPATIVRTSLQIKLDDWIAQRRKAAEKYEFSADETLGEWPGEILGKGSIGLHKEVLSGEFRPEVIIGFATIDACWHLPAVLHYGNWNDCPAPEVHCAFHREWYHRFGAEIVGASGDVIECTVARPPTDRQAATALAWQQYWYCSDIVEQGGESVSNLAALLLNSPYWFFWWD